MGREASSSVTIQWGIMWADVPGVLLCSSVEWVGGGGALCPWNMPSGVGCLGCTRVPTVKAMRFLGGRKSSWRQGDGGWGGWAGWSPDLPRW